MGLRRTGLGPRSHWRLCLRGTAKEFVRLRCVIRRRCGQALILNVVILQATNVELPPAGRESVPGAGPSFSQRLCRRHRETRDARSD
jgi:hypothetical protein